MTEITQRDKDSRPVQAIVFELNSEDVIQTETFNECCNLLVYRCNFAIENFCRQKIRQALQVDDMYEEISKYLEGSENNKAV